MMLSLFLLALSTVVYFVFLMCVSTWVDLPTEQKLAIIFLPLIMAWLKYAAGKLEDMDRRD